MHIGGAEGPTIGARIVARKALRAGGFISKRRTERVEVCAAEAFVRPLVAHWVAALAHAHGVRVDGVDAGVVRARGT
jgi:hypothetical protein